eukprot:1888908-Prymnesium_polylepis.1
MPCSPLPLELGFSRCERFTVGRRRRVALPAGARRRGRLCRLSRAAGQAEQGADAPPTAHY